MFYISHVFGLFLIKIIIIIIIMMREFRQSTGIGVIPAILRLLLWKLEIFLPL